MTRYLALTADEQLELEQLRDRAPAAYLRERAAALLKIADGVPAAQVAQTGLLRRRKPDTIYTWLDRYLLDGVEGLYIHSGRGRKPAFFPCCESIEEAQLELTHLVRRSPRACGIEQTRWTLEAIREGCSWLDHLSFSGVWRVLKRLGISWKRARAAVSSPDPEYVAKCAAVAQAREQASSNPEQVVMLYLDEITVERQPTLAQAYERAGEAQPRAWRSHRSDTLTRIVGTLDAADGRVVFQRASTISVARLVQFYQELQQAYPNAERIYVVQDNWPVHTHPDLLVALEPQECQFAWHRPSNWASEPSAAARKKWGQLCLPIQIVPLPTYASWCNPIEKLWRKLRQDVTHLHRWAHDLDQLRQELDRFLHQYDAGSAELLRYVGLALPN